MTNHDEARIKHLEMVQGVITRLAGNSAGCKRYALAVAGVAAALAINGDSPAVAVAAALVVTVFALVDAKYLAVEKDYRNLYDRARSGLGGEERPDFAMAPPEPGTPLSYGLKSWSVWPVYGALFVALLLLAAISGGG